MNIMASQKTGDRTPIELFKDGAIAWEPDIRVLLGRDAMKTA